MRLPARWQDLCHTDFAGLDRERTVALLAVGAIEQHGPHLPLATDAVLAEAVRDRALEQAEEGLPILVLPTLPIGKSNEHLGFPGTLTLSAETLGRLWYEVGASVARAGVRKLMFLNSHGGQPQVMQIVARELRIRHEMLVVGCSWFQFGLPEGLFETREIRHGIHGGDIETSMMLAVRPELVRMERARNFEPATLDDEERYPLLRSLGAGAYGWMAQDLHPEGVCGNAAVATAEKGRAVIDHAAAKLLTLLREVSALPLSRLRPARP